MMNLVDIFGTIWKPILYQIMFLFDHLHFSEFRDLCGFSLADNQLLIPNSITSENNDRFDFRIFSIKMTAVAERSRKNKNIFKIRSKDKVFQEKVVSRWYERRFLFDIKQSYL